MPVVPSPSEALQPFAAVVLTGGSSGIGKSFIELIRKLKPDLVVCNLSRRDPGDFFSAADRKFLNHFACDLSRPAELAAAAAEVAAFVERKVPPGPVLLINNSGFGAFTPFPEPNLERQLEMVDLNVRAVVHLTGLLLPLLKQRGGAIMNIASVVGFMPTPQAATYGATKAFVLDWTVALNDELRAAKSGVSAIAVCPGTTATAFFDVAGVGKAGLRAGMTMTTEEVVTIALEALAAGKAQVVTGWKNRLMTLAATLVSKPLAAKITGAVLRRMRPAGGAK